MYKNWQACLSPVVGFLNNYQSQSSPPYTQNTWYKIRGLFNDLKRKSGKSTWWMLVYSQSTGNSIQWRKEIQHQSGTTVSLQNWFLWVRSDNLLPEFLRAKALQGGCLIVKSVLKDISVNTLKCFLSPTSSCLMTGHYSAWCLELKMQEAIACS